MKSSDIRRVCIVGMILQLGINARSDEVSYKLTASANGVSKSCEISQEHSYSETNDTSLLTKTIRIGWTEGDATWYNSQLRAMPIPSILSVCQERRTGTVLDISLRYCESDVNNLPIDNAYVLFAGGLHLLMAMDVLPLKSAIITNKYGQFRRSELVLKNCRFRVFIGEELKEFGVKDIRDKLSEISNEKLIYIWKSIPSWTYVDQVVDIIEPYGFRDSRRRITVHRPVDGQAITEIVGLLGTGESGGRLKLLEGAPTIRIERVKERLE